MVDSTPVYWSPCTAEPELPPQRLDLATLACRSKAESERFMLREAFDPGFAYELFRRAIVEQDHGAWEHIYTLYQPLVGRWVRAHSAFASSGERADVFVVTAFGRFWRAMTPARFSNFLTLGKLLQYLRCCVDGALLDNGRSQARAEQMPVVLLGHDAATQPPDEEAYARVSHEEFWRFVTARLRGEAERKVVYDCFVLELKPDAIYQRHHELFSSVHDVYRVKRNVIARLSRDDALRQLHD